MITVTYHVPGDTPHVEVWTDEPTRARMEAKCAEIGACAYTPEVADVDRDRLVSVPRCGGDSGVLPVCAADTRQTR